MSLPTAVSINYSWPNGKTVENSEVDSWELKASRRALRNLKTLLSSQAMLDLLQDQMDEADAYYKQFITKSDGQYRESRIDIKAKGITSAQFLEWWKLLMKDLGDPELKRKAFLDYIVPAHPEHYGTPFSQGVTETIGAHTARVRAQIHPDLPDFLRKYCDPTYQPLSMTGTLDDGSILFYVLHEIRDSEEGFDIILRLLFPALAPQVFFDEHAEHLAVEFRSFINSAFEWHQKKNLVLNNQ
ncbi:unnamed protein product [Umbelopsis ramanniana]